MTSTISPKLKAMLMLSLAVAGFGAWRLLTQNDLPVESGFEPGAELPLVADIGSNDEVRVPDVTGPVSRNPFQRAGSTDSSPVDAPDVSTDPSPSETEESTTTEAPTDGPAPSTSTEPVFPDPDLVDQDPSADGRRSAGDDTSFEG